MCCLRLVGTSNRGCSKPALFSEEMNPFAAGVCNRFGVWAVCLFPLQNPHGTGSEDTSCSNTRPQERCGAMSDRFLVGAVTLMCPFRDIADLQLQVAGAAQPTDHRS